MELVAGIFVGGRASRMGGMAKGLLVAPSGEPIVERTRRLLEEVGSSCFLVGSHPAYAAIDLPVLEDDPGAEGPLAGLLALLERAGDRGALVVACDMPFVTANLLRRLIDAGPAPVVAPRRHDTVRDREFWEPMFARYDARTVLPIARHFARDGGRKLQLLLDAAGACALNLSAAEGAALTDWDRPEDLLRVEPDLPEAARRGTREK